MGSSLRLCYSLPFAEGIVYVRLDPFKLVEDGRGSIFDWFEQPAAVGGLGFGMVGDVTEI